MGGNNSNARAIVIVAVIAAVIFVWSQSQQSDEATAPARNPAVSSGRTSGGNTGGSSGGGNPAPASRSSSGGTSGGNTTGSGRSSQSVQAATSSGSFQSTCQAPNTVLQDGGGRIYQPTPDKASYNCSITVPEDMDGCFNGVSAHIVVDGRDITGNGRPVSLHAGSTYRVYSNPGATNGGFDIKPSC